MDEYIEVKIDVFEHVAQRAKVRTNITISALIEEILKEFDDISADSPGKYAVYLKGNERALDNGSSLELLDIQPQDELVFNYIRQTIRQMLDFRNYAFLKDEAAGRVYDIQWQPALIGRPTNEADHNINLAVNLQLHPKGQTVSRKHAQITCTDGRFFIEPLAENNPISVNGKVVEYHTRKEIKNNDRLVIGRNDLLMIFMTQTAPVVSASREPRSQPAPERAREQPAPLPAQPARGIAPVNPPPPTPIPAAASYPPPGEEDRTYIASNQPVMNLAVERSIQPTKVGQRLTMNSYPMLLGRDIPLLSGEGEISRRHAEINIDSKTGKFYITDLQSTNGVLLQGQRIEPNRPYEILPGMRIGLGQNFLLRFEK
jgi:pSer/pThr/pTyr-binding forkhead associated (FHA) protein